MIGMTQSVSAVHANFLSERDLRKHLLSEAIKAIPSHDFWDHTDFSDLALNSFYRDIAVNWLNCKGMNRQFKIQFEVGTTFNDMLELIATTEKIVLLAIQKGISSRIKHLEERLKSCDETRKDKETDQVTRREKLENELQRINEIAKNPRILMDESLPSSVKNGPIQ